MSQDNLRILIMSDSHGANQTMLDILQYEKEHGGYDIAIHAGDYTTNPLIIPKYFDYYVRGNNDWDHNPATQTFYLAKYKTLLLHGDTIGTYNQLKNKDFMIKYLNQSGYDIIIHGHTHVPKIFDNNDTYVLNPGSIAYPRDLSSPSYMIVTITNNKIVDIQLKHVNF